MINSILIIIHNIIFAIGLGYLVGIFSVNINSDKLAMIIIFIICFLDMVFLEVVPR